MCFFQLKIRELRMIKCEHITDGRPGGKHIISAKQKIKELSKGSRGRLKIVLALSRKASVILLDAFSS
jgi:ABC-type glutathione transport system ATPase component